MKLINYQVIYLLLATLVLAILFMIAQSVEASGTFAGTSSYRDDKTFGFFLLYSLGLHFIGWLILRVVMLYKPLFIKNASVYMLGFFSMFLVQAVLLMSTVGLGSHMLRSVILLIVYSLSGFVLAAGILKSRKIDKVKESRT